MKYKTKQGAKNNYKAKLQNCTYGYFPRYGQPHFALRKKKDRKYLRLSVLYK